MTEPKRLKGLCRRANEIVATACVSVYLLLTIRFFALAEYTGEVHFRCITNLNTGELVTPVVSIALYALAGGLLWLLSWAGGVVVVEELLSAVICAVCGVETKPTEMAPGFMGGCVCGICATVMVLLCGGAYVLGIVVV